MGRPRKKEKVKENYCNSCIHNDICNKWYDIITRIKTTLTIEEYKFLSDIEIGHGTNCDKYEGANNG